MYMQLFTNASQVTPRLDVLYGRKNIAELDRYSNVLRNFQRLYGAGSAYLCSSPGRVEFIGNHLDHNGGKVIAMTVNLDIIVAFRPNDRQEICIAGKQRATLRVNVNDETPCDHSPGLVKGVVRYLKQQGYAVGGFDAYTDSVIPTGAGVSSSAAFELAIATVINSLFNDGAIPPRVLACAGQYAENTYFHKPCGLLDQSVIALGGAVALDFADGLAYNKLNVPSLGLSMVLVNTGASHSALSDLYAQIPADMKQVARFFGADRLADVDEKAFFARYDQVAHLVGERQALRAKHFFEELSRVNCAEQLLTGAPEQCSGGLARDGGVTAEQNTTLLHGDDALSGTACKITSLVNASGDSSMYQLRNCAVNDTDRAIADIVDFARSVCPCGARVHGGGFAGTVLCVVPTPQARYLVRRLSEQYGADRVYPLKLRQCGAITL